MAAAGLFLGLAVAIPAKAAGPKCAPRDGLTRVLTDRYKETAIAMGVSTRGTAMFQIYASKSGTWSIVMIMTNGFACIMAAGHSWESLPAPPAPQGGPL